MGTLLIVPNGADDCPMNATICAIRKYAKDAGYERIYGAKNGFAGLLKGEPDVMNITTYPISILTEGCFLGITREAPVLPPEDSPYFKERTEGIMSNDERVKRITDSLNALNIYAVVVVGGDGTLRATYELTQQDQFQKTKYAEKFIGVINTMDNDINTQTTHATTEYGNIFSNLCLGYSSGVLNLKRRLEEPDTIIRDNSRAFSIETLGRDNGWPLAGASQANCFPLFFPEVLVDEETAQRSIEIVARWYSRFQHLKAGVSEGLRIHKSVIEKYGPELKTEPVGVRGEDGSPLEGYVRICQQAAGQRRLGGAGFFIYMMLAKGISDKGLPIYMSYDNSGYAPRIGRPSMYDLKCADITGKAVGNLLSEKKFGLIPVFSQIEPYSRLGIDQIKFLPLSEVKQKSLPPEYIERDLMFVREAFSDYIGKITSCPEEGEKVTELSNLVLSMETFSPDSELLAKCALGIGEREIF